VLTDFSSSTGSSRQVVGVTTRYLKFESQLGSWVSMGLSLFLDTLKPSLVMIGVSAITASWVNGPQV